MQHILPCTGHELKIPSITKSDGLYLYDEKGKKYLDLESGIWCTSIGHGNAEINTLIKKQLDTLMHAGFCYTHPIVEEAAQRILRLPDFDQGKCVFLCSGSEAVDISRQMARHLSGKPISLTLHDSYLGAYSSFIEKSDWQFLEWDQCRTCPEKETCNPSCEVLERIPENVSEFIFEPGSSSGFVRFPPKAFIENIIRVVRSNGGKIIVNEVTTGIGRTGKWFGYQHYGIKPDFIAVGKGIGNGYPVSVALIDESTAKQLDNKPFHYSQSHQNDPLGASIVLGVIQYIEDNDLITEAEKKGDYLRKNLETLMDNESVLEVRGRGLMWIIELKNTTVTNSVYNSLLEKGYIVGNRGSALRLDPPLTITQAEIDGFIRAFQNIKSCLQ